MDTHLTLTWSTSRGADTYGYNLASLCDTNSGKRYRTCGGGYDMTGTVFGDWLESVYQARLQAIGDHAGSWYSKDDGYKTARIQDDGSRPFGRPDPAKWYGMTRNNDTGKITLDGACGLRCMTDIAEAIGLTVRSLHNAKGNTIGWIVSESADVAVSA